jgi:hypothetical protein
MKTRRTKVAYIGWMIVALILILLVPVSGARAQKYGQYRLDGQGLNDKEKALTEQEKFVLAQAEQGKIANLLSGLLEQIPDKEIQEGLRKLGLAIYMAQLKELKEDKSKIFKEFLNKFGKLLFIRAQFLETLLTGGFPGFKIHRHGVRITNAIVTGQLDLIEAEVEHSFWLADSILLGEANLRDSWFKQNLVLSGVDFEKKIDFERAKIGKDLFLKAAQFHGPVDFMGADIKGIFDATGAQFLDKNVKATFIGMKVGEDALFDNTNFLGPVDFSLVDIKVNFSASGARFFYELNEKEKARLKELDEKARAQYLKELDEKAKARFNGMKVGQTAFFRKTIFETPVDFGLADIKVNFEADEGNFLNKEVGANFNSLKVGHTAHFKRATFLGPVNFVSAEIGSQFYADEVWFLNKEGVANFNSMKVGKHALFRKATFLGPVNFISAEIANQFNADEAWFLNKEVVANFNSMKVGKHASFKKAHFYGPVNFGTADIKGDFVADMSQFLCEKYAANFNGMKVAGLASFELTRFQGPVNFASAYIGNQFIAERAQFTNAVKEVTFNRMEVGQTAFFGYVKFYGPVNFSLINITGNFWAVGTQFLNEILMANFNSMKVGQTALFNKAYFYGPVDFGLADIKGDFAANGAWFLNPKAKADFDSIKVGHTAFFRYAIFVAPVNFIMGDIGQQFIADGAVFLNEGDNTFEGIKIGNYAVFRNASFAGTMSFSYGNFLDLLIYGKEPNGGKGKSNLQRIKSLELVGALVQRDLEIKNIELGRFKAVNCQVKGTATFKNVIWPLTAAKEEPSIKDKTEPLKEKKTEPLKADKGEPLKENKTKPPKPKEDKVDLSGFSWHSLEMPTYSPITGLWNKVTNRLPKWLYPHDNLLYWIENSQFDQRNYLQAEAFFQRTGRKALADKAYIMMKQRENGLDSWWGWLNPWHWPKLLFWDLPVGYGRKPLRILIVAVLFVGVGAWLFNPKYLTHVRWPKKNQFYGVLGRLALSCDICTPSLLNLGMEQDWSPPRVSGRMKIFIFFYKLLGRIFIAVFFLGIWEKFK